MVPKYRLPIFVISAFFFFLSAVSAQAVTGDYNKPISGTLAASEWNNLVNDFVAKSGDRLDGFFSINTATSSTYALDINGAFRATSITGALSGTLNAANISTGLFGSNTGGGNYNFPANIGIGIGTSTPNSSITLANNRWISALNSAGTGYVNMFKVNANDEIEIGGALNIGQFQFAADSGFNTFVDMPVTSVSPAGSVMGYTMKVDGDNILNVYSQSDGLGGISNRRVGINTSTPAYTLDVAGIINATALYVNGMPYIGSQWLTQGTSVYYNSGNVGIGTSTPQSLLDVNGLIKMRSALITANEDVINKGYLDSALASTTAQIITQVSTSSFWQGSMAGNVYNANTGNVGIGTTAPSSPLTVSASSTGIIGRFSQLGAWTGSNYALYVDDGDYTYLSGFRIETPGGLRSLFAPGGQAIGFATAGDSAITFTQSTSVERMRIAAGGNVGIGTTAPTSYLAGTSGLSLYNSNFPGLGLGNSTGYWTMYKSNGDLRFYDSTAVADTRVTFQAGGNVGIGTTTPGTRLTVIGSGNYSIDAGNYRVGNVAAPVSALDAVNKSYMDSAISTATSSITFWGGTVGGNVWNLNSGNVGIGTTNPSQKLEISAGNIKVSNSVSSNTDAPLIVQNTAAYGAPYNQYSQKWLNSAGSSYIAYLRNDGQFYASSIASTRFSNPSYGSTSIVIPGEHEFGFEEAGIRSMTIKNGNVGIGTTNPTKGLEVASDILAFKNDSLNHYVLAGVNDLVGNWRYAGMRYDRANDVAKFGSYLNAPLAEVGYIAISNLGNIGIGTTTPGTRLTVVGSGNYSIDAGNYRVGNVAAPVSALDAVNKSYMDSAIATATSSITFWGGTVGGNVWNLNSGNVGIGTTAPGRTLDVNGIIRVKADSAVEWGWGNVSIVGNNNNELKFLYSDQTVEAMRIKSGNIGIGVTNPIIPLQVANNTGIATIGVQDTRGGGKFATLGAGTAGSIFNFDKTGYFAIFGGTAMNDSGTAASAYYKVFGNTGNTLIGNNSYLTVDTNYKLNINTAGASGYLAITNTTNGDILSINSSGNVGIGTTTPTAKLSLSGGNVFINDAAITSGTPKAAITKEYLDSSLSAFASTNNTWVLNGSNLFASSTAWNVGIGTTNPQVKLDVSGVLASGMGVGNGEIRSYQSPLILPSDYGNYVSLKTSAGKSGIFRSNTDFFLYYDTSTGSTNIVSTISNQPIIFKNLSTELARITSTGNLGIGTTSPTEKLHLSATDYTRIKLDSANSPTNYYTTIENNYNYTGPSFRINSVSGGASREILGRYNNDLAIMKDAGNVGIGTTTPAARLSISGGNAFINDAAITSGTPKAAITKEYLDSSLSAFASTNNTWVLNGSNLFASSTAWNVGIGTTNPSFKLDVNGTSRFADNVRLDAGKNLVFYDKSGTYPTADGGFYWDLNNDSAKIYAQQSASDNIDLIFKLSDNALATDRFLYWIDEWQGESFDAYPLLMDATKIVFNYPTIGGTGVSKNTDFFILGQGASSLANAYFFGDASSGNVGVGNTNPGVKLDVSGSVRLNNSSLILGGINAVPTIDMVNGDIYNAGSQLMITATGVNGLRLTDDNGGFLNMNDNSVGIGTTTTIAKLSISGGNAFINDAAITSGTPKAAITKEYLDSSLSAFASTNNTWVLNGSNLFASSTSWNVGIGTTAPGAKLDVIGNIEAGIATATTAQLTVLGGSGGTDIMQLVRTDGATSTYGWNLAAGRLSFRDVTNNITPMSIGRSGSDADISFPLDQGSSSVLASANGVLRSGNAGQAGTDVSGGSLTIATGKGEGAATSPDLIFQTADATTSGSTQQALSTKLIIKGGGNVGIGTTGPNRSLDVDGRYLGLTSSAGATYLVMGNRDSAAIPSVISSAQGGLYFGKGDSFASSAGGVTTNIMTLLPGGNVGIGTTTPAAKLSISGGNAFINDAAITSGTPKAAITKEYLDSSLSAFASTNNTWVLNGSNLFASSTSWNVGIGTTAPGSKLDVSGNAIVRGSGNYNSNPGSADLQLGYGMAAAGTAGSVSRLSIQPYGHTGGPFKFVARDTNSKAYLDIDYGSNKIVSVDAAGLVGIGTTNPTVKLHVVGTGSETLMQIGTYFNMRADGVLNWGPSMTSGTLTWDTGKASIFGQSGRALSLGSNGVWDRIWIDISGNVGIGTTTPAAKLSISGGNAFINDAAITSGTPKAAITKEYLDSSLSAFATTNNTWILNGSNLYASSTSWNVGIGTTNPGVYRLNVNGDTNITGSLNVTGTTTATAFVGPVVGTLSAGNVSAGTFGANTGGGNYSFSGNLGVGTTNPGARVEITDSKTHVGGDLAGTDGVLRLYNNWQSDVVGKGSVIIFEDNYFSTSFNRTTRAAIKGGTASTGNTADGFLAFYTDSGGGNSITERMRINQAGNVGIGTTAPSAKLHIASTDAASLFALISQTSQGSAAFGWKYNSGAFYGANGNNAIIFGNNAGTSATSYMYISNTGNIGIGTTDPGVYRLKVAGDVAITGTLQTQTGSDFAEEFSVEADIAPGMVVVMSDMGHKSVRLSTKAYDRTVVGIVSDNPSIIAGRIDSEKKAIVAMMGVVSVNVSGSNGSIKKGDLLTSAGLSGYAMKATEFIPGTVIGKALEDMNSKTGRIKVLVNLQ